MAASWHSGRRLSWKREADGSRVSQLVVILLSLYCSPQAEVRLSEKRGTGAAGFCWLRLFDIALSALKSPLLATKCDSNLPCRRGSRNKLWTNLCVPKQLFGLLLFFGGLFGLYELLSIHSIIYLFFLRKSNPQSIYIKQLLNHILNLLFLWPSANFNWNRSM